MNNDMRLVNALTSIANEHWRPDAPIYLSNVPRVLDKTLPDFRSILGDRSIRNFAKSTEKEGGYEVIEDSKIPSRIVLAPSIKQFKFPSETQLTSTTVPPLDRSKKSRAKTLDFINCLSQLSEQEQSQVVIPLNVLIKLLKK